MHQLKVSTGRIELLAMRYGIRFPIFIDMMGNSTRSPILKYLLFSFLIATSIFGILIVLLAETPEKEWSANFQDSPTDSWYLGVPFAPFTVKVEVAATGEPVSGVRVSIVAMTDASYDLLLRNGIEVRVIRCSDLLKASLPNRYDNDDKEVCLYTLEGTSAVTDERGLANFTNFMFTSGLPADVELFIQVNGFKSYGVASVKLKSPLVPRSLVMSGVSKCSPDGVVSFDVSAQLLEQPDEYNEISGCISSVCSYFHAAKFVVPLTILSLDLNGQHLDERTVKYIDDVQGGKVAFFESARYWTQPNYNRGQMVTTRLTVKVKSSSSKYVYIAVHSFGQTAQSWTTRYIQSTCTLSGGVSTVDCSGWNGNVTSLTVGKPSPVPLTCTVKNAQGQPLMGKRVYAKISTIGGAALPPYMAKPPVGTDFQRGNDLLGAVTGETNSQGIAIFKSLAVEEGAPVGPASIQFYADGILSSYLWSGNVVKGWTFVNVSGELCDAAPCRVDLMSNGTTRKLGGWANPPRFKFTDSRGEPVNRQFVSVNVYSAVQNFSKVGVDYSYDSSGTDGSFTFRDFYFSFCTGLNTSNSVTVILDFFSDGEKLYSTSVELYARNIPPAIPVPAKPPCAVDLVCGPRAYEKCLDSRIELDGFDEVEAQCLCRDYLLLCEANMYAAFRKDPSLPWVETQCAEAPAVARCEAQTGTACYARFSDEVRFSYCVYNPRAVALERFDCIGIVWDADDGDCTAVEKAFECAKETNNPNELICDIARFGECTKGLYKKLCAPQPTKLYPNVTMPPLPDSIEARGPNCASLQVLINGQELKESLSISIGKPIIKGVELRALDSLGHPIVGRIVKANLVVVPWNGFFTPGKVARYKNCTALSKRKCQSEMNIFGENSFCIWSSNACYEAPEVFAAPYPLTESDEQGSILLRDIVMNFGFDGPMAVRAQSENGNCVSVPFLLSVKQRVRDVNLTFDGNDLVVTTDGAAAIQPILLHYPGYVERFFHPEEIGFDTTIRRIEKAGQMKISLDVLKYQPGTYIFVVKADGLLSPTLTVVIERLSLAATLTVLNPNIDVTQCSQACTLPCKKDGLGLCHMPLQGPFPTTPSVRVATASGTAIQGVRVLAFLHVIDLYPHETWPKDYKGLESRMKNVSLIADTSENAKLLAFGAVINTVDRTTDNPSPSTFWCTSDTTDANGIANFSRLSLAGAITGKFSFRFRIYNDDKNYIDSLGVSHVFTEKIPIEIDCNADKIALAGVPGEPMNGLKIKVTYKKNPLSVTFASAFLNSTGSAAQFLPAKQDTADENFYFSKYPIAPFTFQNILRLAPNSRSGEYPLTIIVPGALCKEKLTVDDTITGIEVVSCPTKWAVGSTTMCQVRATRNGQPISGKKLVASITLIRERALNTVRKGQCESAALCRFRNGKNEYATTDSTGHATFYLGMDVAPTGNYTLSIESKSAANQGSALFFDNKRLIDLGFSQEAIVAISQAVLSFSAVTKKFLNALNEASAGDLSKKSVKLTITNVEVINIVYRIVIVQQPFVIGSNVIVGRVQPTPSGRCSGPQQSSANQSIGLSTMQVQFFDRNNKPAAGKRVQLFLHPPSLAYTLNPVALSNKEGIINITDLRITSGVAGSYRFLFSADGTVSNMTDIFTVVDPEPLSAEDQLADALTLTLVCMLPLYLANHPASPIFVTVLSAIGTAAYVVYTFVTFCDSEVAAYFSGDYYNTYIIISWVMAQSLLVLVSLGSFLIVILYVMGYKLNKPRFRKLQMESRGEAIVKYVRWFTNVRIPVWTPIEAQRAREALKAEEAEKESWLFYKKPLWAFLYKRPENVQYEDPRTIPIKVPQDITAVTLPNRFYTAMVVLLVFIVVTNLLTFSNIDFLSGKVQALQNQVPRPTPVVRALLNPTMRDSLLETFNQFKETSGPLQPLSKIGSFVGNIDYLQIWDIVFIIANEFQEVLRTCSIIATTVAMLYVIVHFVLIMRAAAPNMALIRKGKLPNQMKKREMCSIVEAEKYIGLQTVHFALGFFLIWGVTLLVFILVVWTRVRTFLLDKLLVLLIALMTLKFFMKIFEKIIVEYILVYDKFPLLVRFRGAYSLWAMFNLILSIPEALLDTVLRWLKGFVFSLLFFPRLDLVLYPSVVKWMDTGNISYWSMLFVEEAYNNPHYLVAIAHMYHAARLRAQDKKLHRAEALETGRGPTGEENMLQSAEDFLIVLPSHAAAVYNYIYPLGEHTPKTSVSSKVAQRWWLMWILYKNPSLRHERKHRLAHDGTDRGTAPPTFSSPLPEDLPLGSTIREFRAHLEARGEMLKPVALPVEMKPRQVLLSDDPPKVPTPSSNQGTTGSVDSRVMDYYYSLL